MATPTDSLAAMRADLASAEADLERADHVGDTAVVARLRAALEPRIAHLRRAIADAEQDRTPLEVA